VQAPFLRRRSSVIIKVMQVPTDRNDVRVLIVDDQASFRRAARAVVELTPGFAVVGEADSGEASVDAVGTLRPQLVLMDVHLSGIDGVEASRRIRAAGEVFVPVIFLLSTYDASSFSDVLAECGATAYLAKGEFGPERLSAAWASATESG
jgi:DNA-binding NarL/FixJ family response regulator